MIVVVMPFRPEAGAPGEIAYQIVSAIFTSFQVSHVIYTDAFSYIVNASSHSRINISKCRYIFNLYSCHLSM